MPALVAGMTKTPSLVIPGRRASAGPGRHKHRACIGIPGSRFQRARNDENQSVASHGALEPFQRLGDLCFARHRLLALFFFLFNHLFRRPRHEVGIV